MNKSAFLSEDRIFRYWLLRIRDTRLPVAVVFGINPSIADEYIDDPTIRKDIRFAARNGCGGLLKLNVGAYRATDPRAWRKAIDPYGPLNTPRHLREYTKQFNAELFVAAWGKNGNFARDHCARIQSEFPELMCLGRNSDGTPRHTLLLPYSTPLEVFTPNGASTTR